MACGMTPSGSAMKQSEILCEGPVCGKTRDRLLLAGQRRSQFDPLQTVALWRAVTRGLSRTPKTRGLATSTVFASRGTSFDHSVGAQEHRLRDREAKRRGGLEVHYEFERGWLLDG